MSKQVVSIIGTGPLGLWTAAALAGDPAAPGLQLRMGNTRGKAPAWMPDAVRAATAQGRIAWRAVDAMDARNVRAFADGSSAIVQTAVPQYHEWAEKLPTMQRSAIAAAHDGARLVCADNLYAYAAPGKAPLTEQSPEHPPSQKGKIRKALLDMMRDSQRRDGLTWATVQASQYFGPGATNQSVFGDWFIEPVSQGKPVRFVGDPSLPHSWAYAPDVGRAIAHLALTPDTGLLNRQWIVPHVTDLPARDVAALLFRELRRQGLLGADAHPSTAAVPSWLLTVLGLFNPVIRARKDTLHQFEHPFLASGAAFAAATGFAATPLDEAIAATVAYWTTMRASSRAGPLVPGQSNQSSRMS